MRMYPICRNCGRSLATSHGLCRLCLLRQIPSRRTQVKLSPKTRR